MNGHERVKLAAERLKARDMAWRNRSIEERCAQLAHEYARDKWEGNHPLAAAWDDLPTYLQRRAVDEFRERLSPGKEGFHHEMVRDFVYALDLIEELEGKRGGA